LSRFEPLQLDRVDRARESYRGRNREIAESGLPMEERLEVRREALREMRTAVIAAYRQLRPQPFGEWLQEREERREQVRPSVDRREEQEQTVHRERRERAAGGEFSRAEEVAQGQGLQRER
jgi:hypothetical protein